jgi:hypothetical protein
MKSAIQSEKLKATGEFILIIEKLEIAWIGLHGSLLKRYAVNAHRKIIVLLKTYRFNNVNS